MAIDYIIGGLQLLSAAVNVLALGAFWITPGLRTTANRFVINLLVVNIIGCVALTPALWLHGGLRPTFYPDTTVVNSAISLNATPILTTSQTDLRDQLTGNDVKIMKSIETKLECNEKNSNEKCDTVILEQNIDDININADDKEIYKSVNVIDKTNNEEIELIDEINSDDGSLKENLVGVSSTKSSDGVDDNSNKNILYSDCTRFWGFDLAAALGGLSVVLVVGDTWCAVTDPLRYHSRVSGLKSWILIISIWFISILFCIASAFRRDCILITTEITSTLQGAYWNKPAATDDIPIATDGRVTNITGDSLEFDDIYNLIFSCVFFIVIILLPICLVCIMYWNIFSEARQNGLRMRQNGSSPLLQSALNLATASTHVAGLPSVLSPKKTCNVIDEEIDDSKNGCDNEQALMQVVVKNNDNEYHRSCLVKVHKNPKREPYHYSNRFLEIPTPSNANRVSDFMHESSFEDTNHSLLMSAEDKSESDTEPSARHLLLLDQQPAISEEEIPAPGELRQVHSTPDLQKLADFELAKGNGHISIKNHSTGSIAPIQNPTVHPPSICTPPKALSYMTSIRHRLSNASSIFKYREESRAARISILVVIMFLVSYFPYGMLVLLQGRVTFIANSSLLGVLFLLIANMSSPFIFAYRNRRVRRGVCRLFGVDSKTNDRLQKQRALLRNSTNSCGGSVKQKTKIVRIDRNTAKSASFSLHTTPNKYAAVAVPLISDSKLPISILACDKSNDNGQKSEDKQENLTKNCCIDLQDDCFVLNESELDMRSGGSNKLEFVLDNAGSRLTSVNNIDTNNKNFRFIQNITNNCSQNNGNGIVDSNIVKEKISLLKRMCKTSRKLSNCTSDSCEKIHNSSLRVCKPISV